jgi:xanthine dehydrogenase accessory factor
MRDVLLTVSTYLSDGEDVIFARVVTLQGFGGRRSGEAMHIGANSVHGHLAMGAADEQVTVAAREMLLGNETVRVITVPVGDDEAITAGLACGGTAEILLQQASTLPPALFDAVSTGTDVMLVTDLQTGTTVVVTAAGVAPALGDAHSPNLFEAVAQAQRSLLKGPKTVVLGENENQNRVLIDPILSTPHLLVLGLAELSNAIQRQATLLGWVTTIAAEAGATEMASRASELGPNDGVVVLSHDIAASSNVLSAALRGNCGYVGALGSRHTQQARAEALKQTHQLDELVIARVHGPVGLDLGSRTPEETALAIAAEMIAVTRGRLATSLTQATGSING